MGDGDAVVVNDADFFLEGEPCTEGLTYGLPCFEQAMQTLKTVPSTTTIFFSAPAMDLPQSSQYEDDDEEEEDDEEGKGGILLLSR